MRKNIFKKGISSIICAAMLFQTAAISASAENTENESSELKNISDDVSFKQMDFALANTSKGGEDTSEPEQKNLVDFQMNTSPSYIPSKYDLRDENYVTSVKDQGEEGLCWAFSTLGSAESNILKQGLDCPDEWKTNGEISLSVNHMAWFPFTSDSRRDELSVGDYIESENKGLAGGNSSIAVAALASGTGAQLTAAESKKSDGSYSEYERYSSFYRLNSSQFLSKTASGNDINSVKQWIMEDGAVDVSFYYDPSFYTYNKENTAYYHEKNISNGTNHEVSIVGWDDDFDVSNFNSIGGTPEYNGAWLIKNSWGKNKNDGYIWVSYYEPSLSSFTQFIMEPSSTSDNIVQYDTSVCVNAYSFDSTANVFTADQQQSLKSIGFYIFNDLSTTIYADAKIYLLKKGFEDPTDGTLVRELKGTYTNTGYKQIPLSNHLLLEKGQIYSIVMSYKYGSATGEKAYSSIEENCESQWYNFHYTSNPGETFVIDKGKWIDSYGCEGKYGTLGNVPIKAYTDYTSESAINTAKSDFSNAIEKLIASDSNYTSAAVYKQAAGIQTSKENSSSIKMLETASLNIYSHLETLGAVKYPENAIKKIGLGDINKDLAINASDAVIMLKVYAGSLAGNNYFLTYAEEKYGDINSDGKIDSKDAVIALQYYANILAGTTTVSLEQYMSERQGK